MVFLALRFQMRSVRSAFFLGCHQKDFSDKCFILPVWKESWISQSSTPLCYLPFSWVPHYFLALFSSYFTIWIFPLQYILKPSHFIYTSYTYLHCIFFYFIFLSPFSSPECWVFFIFYKCSFFLDLSKHNDVFLSRIFLSLHWLFPAPSWFCCLFGTSSSCLRLSSDI